MSGALELLIQMIILDSQLLKSPEKNILVIKFN